MSELDDFIKYFKSGLKKKPKPKTKSKPQKTKSSQGVEDNSQKIINLLKCGKGTPCVTFGHQGKHKQHAIACILHYLGEDRVLVRINTQEIDTGVGTQFQIYINLKETPTVNKLVDKVKKNLDEDSFF